MRALWANRKRETTTTKVTTKVMRWDVINYMLGGFGRFLEIGVRDGSTGRRIRADQKWGVDPSPVKDARGHYHKFFEETSDSFFAKLDKSEKFDVVFVDGLHHASQVYRDVMNALRHLRRGGVVLLHDCNPKSKEAQVVPQGKQKHWNGDCWKALVELRARHSELAVRVIDHDEGLGLVMLRGSNKGPCDVTLSGSAFDLDYETLAQRRDELLGLISWKEAISFHSRLSMPNGLTVVTAIFGSGLFRLHEPVYAPKGCRFVCFTDRVDLRSDEWQVRRLSVSAPTPRRMNRHVKSLIHRYVDGPSFYVDSEYRIVGNLSRLVFSLQDHVWSASRHPERRCAYQEASYCMKIERVESRDALTAQIKRYREENFPKGYGLWAGGAVARRGDADSERLGESWWREIERGSERDQISLAYVSWKLGIKPGLLPGSYHRTPGLEHHREKRGYP